jgi:hypothetical protein
MVGIAGRSGRKTFVPTPEQRNNVKALVGLGIPQEEICRLVINPQTGEPLDQKSLRKHFEREIATGATEAHAPYLEATVTAAAVDATPPG